LSLLQASVTGITGNLNDVQGQISTLSTSLSSEITRSTNKDTELEGKVNAVSGSVVAEQTRAEGVENSLSGSLANIANALSGEIATLANNDNNLLATINAVSGSVVAEATRAQIAEHNISNDVDDLNQQVSSIVIEKDSASDLKYYLKVGGISKGEINIPKDQFLREVTYDEGNKALVFTFETTSGTQTVNVNISDLVDTYTAGDGLELSSDNTFNIKISEASEEYLVVGSQGLKLTGIDNALVQKADAATVNAQFDIIDGNDSVTGSIKYTEKNGKAYTDTQVGNEARSRDEADSNLRNFITESLNNANAERLTGDYQLTQLINAEQTRAEFVEDNLSDQISNLQGALTGEIGRAMTAEAALQNAIVSITGTIASMQFHTANTDTVNLIMSREASDTEGTLTSDVKLKTIQGVDYPNIIKSDSDGLYATVTLDYNKASNVLTFNDGNGAVNFELSNYGILQSAHYDSVNKEIVLTVKKDDSTTQDITIPVADLYNPISVENSQTSPVFLSLTGDNVLSAGLSVQNDPHNLLQNNNGSLFVDDDANSHFALYGMQETTVQAVINDLNARVTALETTIETLVQSVSGTNAAITDIQNQINNLIDFGTYN
jgi:predicted  nucleic acid-binding Zn-ribbon protein